MARATPKARLQHILDSIDKIRGYWAGRSYADFMADEPKRLATERHIEIISEASRHISQDDQSAFAHMPWQQIRMIGNVLRHNYERVAHKELWAVVTQDLDALEHVVLQLVSKDDDPAP